MHYLRTVRAAKQQYVNPHNILGDKSLAEVWQYRIEKVTEVKNMGFCFSTH